MNGNIAAGRLLCKKKPRERPDFSYSLLSGKLNDSRVNLNKVFGLRSLLGRMKKTSHYKWWAVVSIATGTLVTVADIGEVNVAMPTIADEFSSNLSTVQWLATGYLLATSALLMPMGRLSDMIGRKRGLSVGAANLYPGVRVGRDSPQPAGADYVQNPAGHGYRIGPREPDGHDGLYLPRRRTGQGPRASHDLGGNCV